MHALVFFLFGYFLAFLQYYQLFSAHLLFASSNYNDPAVGSTSDQSEPGGKLQNIHTQTLNIWNIYLHLDNVYGTFKCR